MDSTQVLREAGLTVKAIGQATGQPSGAVGSGEIAQPSRFTQMLAIEGELLELAVLTDTRNRIPLEARKREMARRFVRDHRDQQAPYIVKAMMCGEQQMCFDRETKQNVPQPGFGLGYKADISLPIGEEGNFETVKAVPHIVVDGAGGFLQYGKFEPNVGGGGFLHAQEHFCMVLYPIKQGHPFRLLPLGLASASRLDMWNRVAQGMPGRGLPTIEPICHNLLGREGTLFLVYTPPGMWKFDGDDGNYHYGHVFGQTAVVNDRGGFPPYDDEENCLFTEPRVFKVELGERAVRLRYVGRKSQVKLLQGTINLGQSLQVDPFEALGLSVLSANPDRCARTAFAMAGRDQLKFENPLFAYAVKIGLVDPLETDTQSVRSSLSRLADLVVAELRKRLEDIKRRVVEQLCRDVLPDSESVLCGKSAEEVWRRNGGEDFLANWINKRIDGDFDWNSWVHRGVRMELLKRISERAPKVVAPIVAEVFGLAPTPAKRVRKPRAPK